ncbi:MAG: hypothetical protein A2351_00735 [Omnitrophica bacterium RIFOXYB12_FULL_50_7]|nr:MAG: hypothetical protein A2351_00735 [Omnitrophica bacterium RIFOXYB12_FULL_50_7]
MNTGANSRKPVVILHGYSDHSSSFQPLARFLSDNGFKIVDLWLADYLSMFDELSIHDLGQAMGKALIDQGIPQLPKSFDLIAHSTGGLVVRSYLAQYYYGHPDKCPINHLLLLAPANFGSPLATLGKSMLGRIFNGRDWDHLFQTGTRILQALELASPISWELARTDLFDPQNPLFMPKNIYTTVLIGSESYGGLKDLTYENGSDGTVRVSAANLNARYYRLNFQPFNVPLLEEIPRQYEPIAFGVLYGFNHGSIVNPLNSNQDASPLGEIILNSLQIDSEQAYQEHIGRLAAMTERTFITGQSHANLKNQSYHEYQNFIVRVYDQYKEMIPDYFLEFFQKDDPDDKVMDKIHSEILEKVRVYSEDASHRSFLFDITDLKKEILDKGGEVSLNITVAAKSKRISYCNPQQALLVASQGENLFITPNATTFFDIKIDRLQSSEVFKLKKFIP